MEKRNNRQTEAAIRRRGAMEKVIDEYQTPLLRYAARLLNNPTLAQDVVQNTFVKLFRNWQENMHADERLKAWLFRVVHNEAVDMIRSEERRRKHQEGHVALWLEENSVDGCGGAVAVDERISIVLGCLDLLPPAQRQVLLLRMQQGMSYEEISSVTGKTVSYVGNLLHKAVRTLSSRVAKMEGGAQ